MYTIYHVQYIIYLIYIYIYLTRDIKCGILGGNNKPDLARGVGGYSSISILDTGEEGAAVP